MMMIEDEDDTRHFSFSVLCVIKQKKRNVLFACFRAFVIRPLFNFNLTSYRLLDPNV